MGYFQETIGDIAEPAEAAREPAQFVDHVLASRHFSKAPLLSEFLSYTCRRVLQEGVARISEQEIGVNVFRRDEDYDPREDNIVRNYARQLRNRLDDYYAVDGSQDAIRITFPKGGYIPVFVPQTNSSVQIEDDLKLSDAHLTPPESNSVLPVFPKPIDQAAPSYRLRFYRILSLSCAALAVLAAVLLWVTANRNREMVGVDLRNENPLWSRLFQPGVTTTWVSLDSGLVLMSIAARKDVSLEEYIKRDFSRQTKDLSPERASEALTFAYRRYTDYVEVEMVHRFDQLTAGDRSNFVVKFARDVRVNDLRMGNVILHGAPFANPWVSMYEPEMNFVGMLDFDYRGKVAENRGFHFENKHPRANEPITYSIRWNDPNRPLLGSVAFLPGLDKHGVVLIVQGSSLAASEAVQDFVLNDDAFLPFLKSIRKPDGTLPFFEVVLKSHEIDGTPGSCQILTSRVY